MRWRLRSVRTRILLLVLVPVLSLIGIYVFAIGSTARDAVNLSKANTVKNTLGEPIAGFMSQLSTERLQSGQAESAGDKDQRGDGQPAQRPYLRRARRVPDGEAGHRRPRPGHR